MKEDKIVKTNLKTLLKRYSNDEALNELENNKRSEQIKSIDIDSISLNPCFDEAKYENDVILSYKEYLSKDYYSPIVVRPNGKKYEVVIGMRTFLCAKLMGFDKVNCLIKEISEEEALLIISSHIREAKDSNVVLQAFVSKTLKEKYHYKSRDLAVLFSQSESQVSNILHLLKLNNRILNLILNNYISYGHAKAFSRLPIETCEYIVSEILKKSLSVRDVEQMVRDLNTQDKNELQGIRLNKNRVVLTFKNEKEAKEGLEYIIKSIKKGKLNI